MTPWVVGKKYLTAGGEIALIYSIKETLNKEPVIQYLRAHLVNDDLSSKGNGDEIDLVHCDGNGKAYIPGQMIQFDLPRSKLTTIEVQP